jgi:hypothetical protein
MNRWQIVEEPDFDRIGIINVEMGCEVYLPRWSHAQIDIAHAPRESGIRAEWLSYHLQDTWTCSLTHGESPGETCTPPYLLEVWMDACLILKLQLPFACGEQLRHTWLERR